MKKLIKKYKKLIKEVVNPDELTWDDIGVDDWNEAPFNEYKDINEYLEYGGDSEFDEGQQTELRIYHEIIEDLEKWNS